MVILDDVEEEEIEEEQKKIEEERIREAKKDAEEFERQRIKMMKLQEEAKNELFHKNLILAKELEQKEMDAILRARERRALLNREFMREEAALGDKINKADGILETTYKKVSIDPRGHNQKLISDSKEREFKVNWRSTPQLINVRIELCRCLRDKIGECHCVITCSVIDQIGGNILTYQDKENIRNWTETTKPKRHDGHHLSEALRFEENIVLVSPSKFIATPSTALLFELCVVVSGTSAYNETIGWGVFPLLNQERNYNKGRFKVPLLFGPVDNSIKRYEDIENTIRNNLDTWICNLYFSIILEEALDKPYVAELNYNKPNTEVLDVENEDDIYLGDESKQYLVVQDFDMDRNEPHVSDTVRNELAVIMKEDSTTVVNQDKLVKPEDFDKHHYHIPGLKLESRANFANQTIYIVNEILSDLGFRNVFSLDFWLSVLILLLVIWGRSYVHPFGSWIFLKMAGIPITAFDTELYGFILEYPVTSIGIEIGVIIFGNILVPLVFLALIALCWILQTYIKYSPILIYRLTGAYGIATIMDFLLLMLVDVSIGNQSGEYRRLYNFYDRIDKTGVIGIFIIAFIYFAFAVINCFIFYSYIVFLHMNGRLLDIYRRVVADEDHFFFPHDNEISLRILQQILDKVKKENDNLKGMPGMKHFAISKHVLKRNKTEERSIYIALYEKTPKNRLELYRHFLMLANGSICELEKKLSFTVDDYPLAESLEVLMKKHLEEDRGRFLDAEDEGLYSQRGVNVIDLSQDLHNANKD